jgi:hypothetical protein
MLSCLLALAIPAQSPPLALALPGMAYWLLVLSGPLLRRRLRRRLAAMEVPA